MRRQPLTLGPALLAALALLGCEQGAAPGQGPPAKRGPRANGAPKGKPPAPVAVAPVVEGDIFDVYESTATLEAERTAPVLARAKGLVQAVLVEEGDAVKAGQVLLRIDPADLALRVEQAAATTAGLEDRFERLEGMVKQELAPAEELETTRHELRSAQAEEKLARLALSRTRVRAPFSGRVVRRLVAAGQSVDDGTPVFEVADLDPLLARVHVPSKALARIAPAQPVTLTLDSTGRALEGRIQLVSPVIDPSTGTIKVTVEIPEYPEGTRPGDFAAVRVVTERREGRRLVPRGAIVEDKGQSIVFVAVDGRAQRREVKVGLRHEDRAEILEGLALGEKVVTKGQHALEDGQGLEILEE